MIRECGLPKDAVNLRRLKAMGFSDRAWRNSRGSSEDKVRAHRRKLGVTPGLQAHRHLRRRIRLADRLHVLDLRDRHCRAMTATRRASSERKKIIILGGGPNRIGQGIEFDYCCCHACFALHDAGYELIMVNCNPETVSTDYDTSDRLYFEPLTAEDVLEIIHAEQSNGTLAGVIVQFGGQTPLNLAQALGSGRRADPRHDARRHRSRRGPRPLRQAPARS